MAHAKHQDVATNMSRVGLGRVVACCLATASLGAVWSRCAPDMGHVAILDRFQQIEPKVLIADERRLARFQGDGPGVPTVLIERDFEKLWNYDLDAKLPEVDVAEDDPAVLLFTSGTTGRPKAAMLSHRSLIAFVMQSFFIGARRAMCEPAGGKPGDRPCGR